MQLSEDERAQDTEDHRIRVAFCHYTSDVGGGSDYSLLELITHLPRARFAPQMILKAGDPMGVCYKEQSVPVHETHLFHPRRTTNPLVQGRFALAFWPGVFRLVQILRCIDPHVVHVNTLNNLQGAIAARLARKPLVWHVRELGSGKGLDALQRSLPQYLGHRTIAISQAVGETLRACGARLHVIPNGIDMRPYDALPSQFEARERLGVPLHDRLVVCPGRLEPWKGQHVLIEAMPAILAQQPDAWVAFIGAPAANKPGYAETLRAACAELGIEGRVRFAGHRSDVPIWYAAADVAVLPTATAEPFGRTAVEAMAAGVPVVATAAGGPLETVRDGETGFLVPPGDAGALAEKVIELLNDTNRARLMGQLASRWAREQFAIERVARELGNVLEAVVAEAGNARDESHRT